DPTNPGPPTDVVMVSKAYAPAGRLASVTDAMGWVTSYTYTDNGLTARVTRRDPASGATFVTEDDTYDPAGNLATRTTNNGATTVSYLLDPAGRTTSSTADPTGLRRTITSTYSADHLVLNTTVSDPAGPDSPAYT